MATWHNIAVFRKYKIFECRVGDIITIPRLANGEYSYKKPKFIVSIKKMTIDRFRTYDFDLIVRQQSSDRYKIGNSIDRTRQDRELPINVILKVLIYEGDDFE